MSTTSSAGGGGRVRAKPVVPEASAAGSGPPASTDDQLAAGVSALSAGRWREATDTLRSVEGRLPESSPRLAAVAEGLSEALWWLGHADESLAARERAYRLWRQQGDHAAAARAAAWLAREYAAAVGNEAASRGWLARADTVARGAPGHGTRGWVALAAAILEPDPAVQRSAAADALDLARRARDADLEVLALGRLGLATIAAGELEEGLARIDEAMAAATAGEAGLSTLAALCCDLVRASELTGELERFAQWNAVVESLAARHGHPPLVAFCATCCAEVFVAVGDWAGAEQQLRGALELLRRSGHPARCVAPAAKLAELLVHQGRHEEAETVLDGDDSDDSLLVRARLCLARDEPVTAARLAERQRRRLGGDSLLTAPALALLVRAELAADDLAAAREAAGRLTALGGCGHRRTMGWAALARGRVAAAGGAVEDARAAFEQALDHLSAVAPGALETAEAHLELARLCVADAPKLAAGEAKAAVAGFNAAGAASGADAATALLRSVGDRSVVGDKNVGLLTRREQQVLQLVAQGLTNAEVAERLFISPKTAGHHVSNVLAKLGLRSRVEAAAYAARRPAD